MTVDEFVDELSSVSLPNVFNPYRDICALSDHSNSPFLRQQNLSFFLDSVLNEPRRSIWLGRDLGYRGGRRTGIALTDEYHLEAFKRTFGVCGVVKATLDEEPVKERTATEVWKLLRKVKEPIFLWNVFPFHPYDEGDPFSNRRHTTHEFEVCRHMLVMLLEWLEPTTIIALGADAESALLSIGYECKRVRHPSYGGQNDFARQICEIYDLEARNLC